MRRTLTHGSAARAALVVAVLALLPLEARAQAARESPPVPTDDPFGRRAWHLELTGHGAVETWNYNISHEEMAGFAPGITYGLGKGVVLKIGSPLYRVWQRGTDGYLFGVTWGVRSRVLRRPRWSLFWEFEVGISEADTYVPPGGTRFNYVALGGGGATVRLRAGVHALAGLRWIHLSNNSLAGRSRNPDIEAVGPTLGVVIGF
jgi:hypothetical protein